MRSRISWLLTSPESRRFGSRGSPRWLLGAVSAGARLSTCCRSRIGPACRGEVAGPESKQTRARSTGTHGDAELSLLLFARERG